MRLALAVVLASGCATAPSTRVAGPTASILATCPDPFTRGSRQVSQQRHPLVFFNATSRPVRFFWHDFEGGRALKGEVPPGEATSEGSWPGHFFTFTDDALECLGSVELRADVSGYVITDQGIVADDPRSHAGFERVRANQYLRRDVKGVSLLINRHALTHPEETERMIALLIEKALEARTLVPARWRPIVDRVPFWVEWERRDSSQFRYIIKKDPLWVQENTLKWGGIEVTSVRDGDRLMRFAQPWVLIHEYAHAIHDAMGPDDKKKVNEAWRAARAKSARANSYGFKNDGEFLAEHAEAWVGFFGQPPHLSADVREQEPMTAALLEDFWGPAPPTVSARLTACVNPLPRSAEGDLQASMVRWVNRSVRDVELIWVNPRGELEFPTRIPANSALSVGTRQGHVTAVRELNQTCLGTFTSLATRVEVVAAE